MLRKFFLMLVLTAFLFTGAVACGGGGGGDDDDDDSAADDDDDDDDDDDAATCVDTDGDGFGENCEAGPDCNDGDANAYQILTGYVDADHDGYAGTSVGVCAGDALPAEFFADAPDCDDEDPMINPTADELPDELPD
ncbi:hypothetical protein KDL45_13655, partial [bacterium]|nr:hypothetical protein [bacterium]